MPMLARSTGAPLDQRVDGLARAVGGRDDRLFLANEDAQAEILALGAL